ncbi:hypothetical protein PBOI14_00060 [Pseudomonas sp. Boi14]|nr:hypothetical protein PBOI14_00060 [Pseudomonas sp. Boi14]
MGPHELHVKEVFLEGKYDLCAVIRLGTGMNQSHSAFDAT